MWTWFERWEGSLMGVFRIRGWGMGSGVEVVDGIVGEGDVVVDAIAVMVSGFALAELLVVGGDDLLF